MLFNRFAYDGNFEYGTEFNPYMDIDGNPIERTPETHRYNYDTFVQWQDKKNVKLIETSVYSDRLWQWSSKKYDSAHQEVFGNRGQIFYDSSPNDVEKFLQLYTENQNLKLVRILQGCNQSSGYPFWVFEYYIKK